MIAKLTKYLKLFLLVFCVFLFTPQYSLSISNPLQDANIKILEDSEAASDSAVNLQNEITKSDAVAMYGYIEHTHGPAKHIEAQGQNGHMIMKSYHEKDGKIVEKLNFFWRHKDGTLIAYHVDGMGHLPAGQHYSSDSLREHISSLGSTNTVPDLRKGGVSGLYVDEKSPTIEGDVPEKIKEFLKTKEVPKNGGGGMGRDIYNGRVDNIAAEILSKGFDKVGGKEAEAFSAKRREIGIDEKKHSSKIDELLIYGRNLFIHLKDHLWKSFTPLQINPAEGIYGRTYPELISIYKTPQEVAYKSVTTGGKDLGLKNNLNYPNVVKLKEAYKAWEKRQAPGVSNIQNNAPPIVVQPQVQLQRQNAAVVAQTQSTPVMMPKAAASQSKQTAAPKAIVPEQSEIRNKNYSAGAKTQSTHTGSSGTRKPPTHMIADNDNIEEANEALAG